MPEITAQAKAWAETTIRTAIVAEHNLGRLISFAEEGVQIIEWVAVLDDATTDECLGLNGLQWRLPDDLLDFAAYEGVGHDVPFPGAVAHWNCRSTIVPVDEDGAFLALPLANGGSHMTSRKRQLLRKIHAGCKLVGNEAVEASQLGLGDLLRSENSELYLSTTRSLGIKTPAGRKRKNY
jgi:hypothetical protein